MESLLEMNDSDDMMDAIRIIESNLHHQDLQGLHDYCNDLDSATCIVTLTSIGVKLYVAKQIVLYVKGPDAFSPKCSDGGDSDRWRKEAEHASEALAKLTRTWAGKLKKERSRADAAEMEADRVGASVSELTRKVQEERSRADAAEKKAERVGASVSELTRKWAGKLKEERNKTVAAEKEVAELRLNVEELRLNGESAERSGKRKRIRCTYSSRDDSDD